MSYNPNVHCDVCEGSGGPCTAQFPNARRCWHCEGSGNLPICKKCDTNGVWSGANVCNQCDSEPVNLQLELYRPFYRSYNGKHIEELICINPDRSIEIVFYSSLSTVETYQYREIIGANEVILRYYLDAFQESSIDQFEEARKSLPDSLI